MVETRRLLEVLKWTPAEDILYSTSLVSRLWQRASESDEVWISLSHAYSLTSYRPEGQSFKEGFCLQMIMLLPVLSRSSLKVFNCQVKTYVKEIQFQGTLDYNDRTAAVILQDGGLVAIGGGSKLAYHISPFGIIQKLQSMRNNRNYPSFALVNDIVYVFGGDQMSNRTAEKLRTEPLDSIIGREWEALPDSLEPHSACQPCVRSTLIYLCGGNTNKSETFDPISEEYSLLPFVLPETLYGCVSFYRSGELILFTQKYVSRWRPGNDIQSKQNTKMYSEVWTNMKQVLIGNFLFTAVIGAVRVFDLQEGRRRFELDI